MLADFITDNGVSIVFGLITCAGGLSAWLTRMARQMTRLEAGQEFIIENMTRMGNDSATNRDSVRDRVDRIEQQVNGLSVELARWQGGHARPT